MTRNSRLSMAGSFKKRFPFFYNKLLKLRFKTIQYSITHFSAIWYLLLNTPIIKKYGIGFFYNFLSSGIEFPFPYRTKNPFMSVGDLQDYSYYSRILPEKLRSANYEYPSAEEIAEDLLLRKNKCEKKTDRNSSLLFGSFAQWFAAGFLMVEQADCGRSALYPTSAANLNAVYGNDEKSQLLLRSLSGGKLKSQFIKGEEYPLYLKEIPELIDTPLFKGFLQRPGTKFILNLSNHTQYDINTLFAFGQIQINATPGTIAWGVIFLREHNQVCEELHKLNPEWDDERLYQTARNICVMILNRILVIDYIGTHNSCHLAMKIPFEPAYLRGRKWSFGLANSLPIEWNHLYRFHSFIPDTLLFKGKEIPLTSAFYDPNFVTQHGLETVIDQLSRSPICCFGPQNIPYFLIHVEKHTIEEGRLLNLATYNDYRERMGMPRAFHFEDINSNQSVIHALRKHYKSVDEIEFYVGMMAEEVPADRLFPPLLNRILSAVAFNVIMLQLWLAPTIWSRRDELLTSFGRKRVDDSTIQTLIYRHISKEAYVSFFMPQ